MADLPLERLTQANPFECTTVDLFGPYKVKDEVKKTKLKVYGIVFCCMGSRVIHTDLVGDQSSEGFLINDLRHYGITTSNCGEEFYWSKALPSRPLGIPKPLGKYKITG